MFFLFLIGSLASGSDLKVTTTNRHLSPPLPSAIEEDKYLSLDAGFTTQTIYVSGSSQRVEYAGFPGGVAGWMESNPGGFHGSTESHTAVITHCDTGIVDELNLDSHEYREFKMPPYPDEKNYLKLVDRARKALHNDLQVETVDTGETRVFFGHTAKHLITTIGETSHAFHTSSLDAHTRYKVAVKEKIVAVVDGWYLDQPQPGCVPEFLRHRLGQAVTSNDSSVALNLLARNESGGRYAVFFDFPLPKRSLNEPVLAGWDHYRAYTPGIALSFLDSFPYLLRETTLIENPRDFRQTRFVYTGYMPGQLAVQQKITSSGILAASRALPEEKREIVPLAFDVTELSDSPLDPALFAVPPDFKKVK
jgi:hypothetical protein